jgi:NADH-quinone oxidoreductase subunit L
VIWAKPTTRGESATSVSAGWQRRFAPVHRLFLNKWYFDELIDLVIVRPVRGFGRWAHDAFERLVIGGAIVGGTTGAVRGASAVVRRLQSGYLRTYSAVVLSGLAVLVIYFLTQS